MPISFYEKNVHGDPYVMHIVWEVTHAPRINDHITWQGRTYEVYDVIWDLDAVECRVILYEAPEGA